eukprot:1735266-Lingulodinium_polyedra.AAC.1
MDRVPNMIFTTKGDNTVVGKEAAEEMLSQNLKKPIEEVDHNVVEEISIFDWMLKAESKTKLQRLANSLVTSKKVGQLENLKKKVDAM